MKEYGSGEARVTAVGGINLDVQSGTLLAIMGESGSGKSTLLSMLGALNTPTSGKYKVDGVDVYSLGQEERADFRRKFLGFVFQSFHLVPYLSVRENIMLAPRAGEDERKGKKGPGGRGPPPGWAGREEPPASQPDLRRGTGARGHRPGHREPASHSSGGRTDGEPRHQNERRNHAPPPVPELRGTTIIMVTHNPENAEFAHRVIHLKDGRINNGRVPE